MQLRSDPQAAVGVFRIWDVGKEGKKVRLTPLPFALGLAVLEERVLGIGVLASRRLRRMIGFKST